MSWVSGGCISKTLLWLWALSTKWLGRRMISNGAVNIEGHWTNQTEDRVLQMLSTLQLVEHSMLLYDAFGKKNIPGDMKATPRILESKLQKSWGQLHRPKKKRWQPLKEFELPQRWSILKHSFCCHPSCHCWAGCPREEPLLPIMPYEAHGSYW